LIKKFLAENHFILNIPTLTHLKNIISVKTNFCRICLYGVVTLYVCRGCSCRWCSCCCSIRQTTTTFHINCRSITSTFTSS